MNSTTNAETVAVAELNIRLGSIERALNLQAEAVKRQADCPCHFSNEEISTVRDFVKILHETRSGIIKGLITAVVGGALLLLTLGFKIWSKQ